MKILVVDDEKTLVKGMKFNLENEGYEVECAYDGAAALELAREGRFDLIILDVMMPEMDGLEACMKIREFSNVPIIMLTAKSEDADKLMGFECGADDYLTKPFNILELKARIRALLRRAETYGTPAEQVVVYRVGGLEVSPSCHLVKVNGQDIALTLKEFELLCLLLENRGIVLSRDKILDKVWGDTMGRESRTVDVHIRTLRQKLGPCGERIETVRGIGYKFQGEA